MNLFSPSSGLWISDLNGSLADIFTGSPETFKLSVPVGSNPVMVIGPGQIGQRNYVIAQGPVTDRSGSCNLSPTTAPAGEADAIEVASNTVSARIPLGSCPVYAVESPDGKRLFVLNRGGDATNPNGSISVINSQNNTSDSCTHSRARTGSGSPATRQIPLPPARCMPNTCPRLNSCRRQLRQQHGDAGGCAARSFRKRLQYLHQRHVRNLRRLRPDYRRLRNHLHHSRGHQSRQRHRAL